MKPKVIFIVNAIQSHHCIKRINEFLANGYNVKVYGFKRDTVFHTKPEKFDIEILRNF